jgi:hypothetical protein
MAMSMKIAVFWNVAPCSLVATDWRLRGALRMGAVRSSEASENIYQTTWRSIPEDSHLYVMMSAWCK